MKDPRVSVANWAIFLFCTLLTGVMTAAKQSWLMPHQTAPVTATVIMFLWPSVLIAALVCVIAVSVLASVIIVLQRQSHRLRVMNR